MELTEKFLNYQKQFRFLSRIFLKEVDQELLNSIKQKDLIFISDNPLIKQSMESLREYAESATEKTITELAVDYVNSFAGFSHDCSFPYESVYTSPERILMQDARDRVLEIYKKDGYSSPFKENEPEDHLANELEYMAFLSQKIIDSLQKNEKEATKLYLQKQQTFLDNHLNNWIADFCNDIKKIAKTDFYIAIAQITENTIADYASVLSYSLLTDCTEFPEF